jgi:hypothetical protein
MFGEPVVTCLRAFLFARGAAGASRIRHFLRPLFLESVILSMTRRRWSRGNEELRPVYPHPTLR